MPHEPIGSPEDPEDVRYWTWGRDDPPHPHGGLGDLADRDYGAFREHRPPWLGPSRDAKIMRGVPQQRAREDRVAPVKVSRSDGRILEDVCESLAHEGWLDATHVVVTVDAQHVTLDGEVTDRRQKWLAEDAAERVLGVRAVVNRLRVRRLEAGPEPEVASRETRSNGNGDRDVRRPGR